MRPSEVCAMTDDVCAATSAPQLQCAASSRGAIGCDTDDVRLKGIASRRSRPLELSCTPMPASTNSATGAGTADLDAAALTAWLEQHVAGFRGPIALTKLDRKSTRLNSSHSQISYAVFCLKKKISRSESRDRSGATSSASNRAPATAVMPSQYLTSDS